MFWRMILGGPILDLLSILCDVFGSRQIVGITTTAVSFVFLNIHKIPDANPLTKNRNLSFQVISMQFFVLYTISLHTSYIIYICIIYTSYIYIFTYFHLYLPLSCCHPKNPPEIFHDDFLRPEPGAKLGWRCGTGEIGGCGACEKRRGTLYSLCPLAGFWFRWMGDGWWVMWLVEVIVYFFFLFVDF